MPKYLLHVNYVGEGFKGLLKEGGTKRRAAADQLVASTGGSIEAMYYALGDTDCFVITDMPDQASAVAASLALNASGAITSRVTPLMTVEDMDQVSQKSPSYRPPGSSSS